MRIQIELFVLLFGVLTYAQLPCEKHKDCVGSNDRCCRGFCSSSCDTLQKLQDTSIENRKPVDPTTESTIEPTTERTTIQPPITTTNASELCRCKEIVKASRLYRSYNYLFADHFYTISASEYNNVAIIGWVKEDPMGFVATTNDPRCPNLTQIYRMWSFLYTNHFYTIDRSEVNDHLTMGYLKEVNQGYCSTTPGCGLLPLYHLSNALLTDDFYTIYEDEMQSAQQKGYIYVGIECYVYQ
ncbi:hypothetical protein M3Y95_01272600 [Aphelenchoides besseyi]|nr:hypothetical protein M3Y95_01272600 [Aphelenchoides besseyi]